MESNAVKRLIERSNSRLMATTEEKAAVGGSGVGKAPQHQEQIKRTLSNSSTEEEEELLAARQADVTTTGDKKNE